MINGKTRLYGIIGNPVGHSLSPIIHNAAFQALGLNKVYVPLPVTDLKKGLTGIRALGFHGISVTVPYKEEVITFIDTVEPVAQNIGAVNTLLVENNAKIQGFNTDWIGANRALQEKMSLQGSRVLLVGAGGAARAIGFGLQEAGAEVILANRTVEKAATLGKKLGCRYLGLEKLDSVKADALINATSVGMEPHIENSPVSPKFLDQFTVVMDIVYAPRKTRLLKDAQAAGCQVIDGLAMLLNQAVAQFELWTGKKAPVSVMRKALLDALQ